MIPGAALPGRTLLAAYDTRQQTFDFIEHVGIRQTSAVTFRRDAGRLLRLT
jgi:hypothetical protein